MRATQIMGLTAEAVEFLNQKVKKVPAVVCPHCGQAISTKMDSVVYESASDQGMFDDGPELHQYNLAYGGTVREVVQATQWSSGPCIFLCLETDKGKRMFEWQQKSIDEA